MDCDNNCGYQKKSRNKDMKAFLKELTEIISYFRNLQNTKKQSDY